MKHARWPRGLAAAILLPLGFSIAQAADVAKPSAVSGLVLGKAGSDAVLSWNAVTTDVLGAAETVTQYRVYRGTVPTFVPDKIGGTNRIGTSATTSFTDPGALTTGIDGYYLITAVDAAGNESESKPSTVTTLPTLTGTYTDTTVELSWTAGAPGDQVAKYLIYYGTTSHVYDSVHDAGPSLSASMTGLSLWVNYFFTVVAVDVNGNETAMSAEHVEAVAGRVKMRAHDGDNLCWIGGGQSCPPRAGVEQRNGGFQIDVPVDFPVGSWTKVTLDFTMDSRLCKVGQMGCTDKCGNTNPVPGGWNPCGDPWDRTASLFLVLDDCIDVPGANCLTNDNLELIHAITPFGTDAAPPLGTGKVPPRVVSLDVTPYVPLLTGTRWVGADIAEFASAGWHVTSEFTFSKRPEEASPKTPAAGIQVVGFGGAPLPTRTVSIPLEANKVVMRLFTTGHGGTLFCDGGTNDGGTCVSSANCPGGTCQPCDEFCHRTNRILSNGVPIYTVTPWRTDCSPAGSRDCQNWNACGWPSCTFSRAGWCPGYLTCTNTGACDQDIDMTAQLPPGGSYDIDYDVLVQRGSWAVSLVLYWYTP
jgi:hypothetical protein